MAWYKTGTIAIAGNTVTGSGTNWTDNKMGIGPGQALLVPGAGAVKFYEILRVDSATKLTLTSKAEPVAAGGAYAILSFYTDSVPDFARRLAAQLSYYQRQQDGWQQIMTGTGTINIESPDGTVVAISSFKKLTDDMNGKADKSGLGTAAGKNTGTAVGDVMTVGAFGVGNKSPAIIAQDQRVGAGFYCSKMLLGGISNNVSLIEIPYDENTMYQIVVPTIIAAKPKFYGRTLSTAPSYNGQIVEFYTTGNTVKASDGTLKAASPIVRIVKSESDSARADVADDDFSWCGAGTANGEAAGITITRIDTGVYSITGTNGLAVDGWRLLPPRDPDGSGDLGIVDAEEGDGVITIRLYKRRWKLNDDGDIESVRGALIDVPANSWIDVRLQMPETESPAWSGLCFKCQDPF